MPRRSHPSLAGLGPLGARLREIRTRAGISQAKLAGLIGFEPTHGYKYILRLEKGLVPNPTLRTIAAILEACGATWPQLADVLPATGERPAPVATPKPAEPEPEPEPVQSPRPAAPQHRDPRPLRERLRQQRIEQQAEHARSFWLKVAAVEEQTVTLLRSAHVPPSRHREYLGFVRQACTLIDTHASSRPGVAAAELDRLRRAGTESGLDASLLGRITDTCRKTLNPCAETA
jgi:transcriptional regulator with XRE-family HTH domain